MRRVAQLADAHAAIDQQHAFAQQLDRVLAGNRDADDLARQIYRISSAIFTEELSTTGITGMHYGVLNVQTR